MKYSFGGFTGKANAALNIAISSAEQFGHTYIGSEHLLLGLISVEDCVAAQLLNECKVFKETVIEYIETKIGKGSPTRLSPEHLTPRAKNAIELSVSEVGGQAGLGRQ